MKLIMENWNRFVNESKDKGPTVAGDAGGQFVQAVKMIQSAMARHDFAGSGHGTYDPLGTGDSGAAWDHYGDTLETVFEDKEFQAAKTMLMGLYVVTEYDEEYRIVDVKGGNSTHEAGSALYIGLASPIKTKGKREIDESLRIGEDSFYYGGVHQVNNEPRPGASRYSS